MGKRAISTTKLTETLSLSECHDGFWLYDYTQGMNLAMRAKTPEEAFTKAITYYQRRLKESEKKYKDLSGNVGNFIESLKILENDPFDLDNSDEWPY